MKVKDPDALARLAAASVPREQLQREGYLPLLAWADLHPFGYTVRHWLRPRDGAQALEYLPRLSELPRVCVTTYEQQAGLHRALGLNVVRPGEPWADCPLFAGLEV